MKYKTYLFDFDGTLVNSMPAYISVILRILEENAIPYEKDIVKIITPLGDMPGQQNISGKWEFPCQKRK